ncbi:MAG: hypothetical protein K6F05_00820 [Succinivibrio sp.]|nr:hypothetical protein [Succinivibrio sp.]
MADEKKESVQDKAPAAEKGGKKTRVVMQQDPALKTVYANAFYTQFKIDELLLTACVSQQASDGKNGYLNIVPQARIGMTINSAVQLAEALNNVIAQYRQQYASVINAAQKKDDKKEEKK